MLKSEEFLSICKNMIRDYLKNTMNVNEAYDIYLVWKDYFTVGQGTGQTKSLKHHKAIFETTLDDGKLFNMEYVGVNGEIIMQVYKVEEKIKYDVNEYNPYVAENTDAQN